MDIMQLLNGQLSNFAGDILTSSHSLILLGEVEVPECLKEQFEENNVAE